MSEIKISDIGVGILSCNRRKSIARLIDSIHKHLPPGLIVVISDESTDQATKDYLRSIAESTDWLKLIDNRRRRGICYNSNRLLRALAGYQYKLMLNDDVVVLKDGWASFYFEMMLRTGYHHFCYRQIGIYGAKEKDETVSVVNGVKIKTIKQKPHGAVMAFDQVAFQKVGYFDVSFPRYGCSHVDWSHRVGKSGIQPPGFHDVVGAEDYFKIIPEPSVEKQKSKCLREARALLRRLQSVPNRIYVGWSGEPQ